MCYRQQLSSIPGAIAIVAIIDSHLTIAHSRPFNIIAKDLTGFIVDELGRAYILFNGRDVRPWDAYLSPAIVAIASLYDGHYLIAD